MNWKRIAAVLVMVGAIAFGTFVFVTAVSYVPSEDEGLPATPAGFTVKTPGIPEAGSPKILSVPQSYSPDVQREVSAPPVRLIIPALGVNARIQHVGVTNSGDMATPNNFTDVGWYRYGTIPGNKGSAVIAGHVDNGLSLPGVFKRLSDIMLSDDIYVENASGTLHFIVDGIDHFDYREVPAEWLFGKNDAAHLRLITCEGDWIQEKKTYDERIVISAHLIDRSLVDKRH